MSQFLLKSQYLCSSFLRVIYLLVIFDWSIPLVNILKKAYWPPSLRMTSFLLFRLTT